MPVFGRDLSSGARAGLTAFLAGVARSVAHANVTINNILPGYFDTDRYRAGIDATAKAQGKSHDAMHAERVASVPAGRAGDPAEFGDAAARSEEHTSELQSLMRISYAVFCLQKKNTTPTTSKY